LALQCLSPTAFPYSHPCIRSVWDLAVWTCCTSEATSFKHVFFFVFAAGWGTTGFCLIWGNKKTKRDGESFSCCNCQKQGKLRVFQALQAAEGCERTRSKLMRADVQLLPPVPPARPWQNPKPQRNASVGAPSLPPATAPATSSSYFSRPLLPDGNAGRKSHRSSQRHVFFISCLQRRAEERRRGGEVFVELGFIFFYSFFLFFLQHSLFRGVSCVINAEWLRQLLRFKVVSHPLAAVGDAGALSQSCACNPLGPPRPAGWEEPQMGGRGHRGVQGVAQGYGDVPPARSPQGAHVWDSPSCGGWLHSHPKWPERG